MNTNLEKVKKDRANFFEPLTDPATVDLLQNGVGGNLIPQKYIIWETRGANQLISEQEDHSK
jgi:hypothetical protein